MSTTIQQKSEILFIYESTYTIPNGDPFTGEQRYDEETKKILVSDVRIKRYIRDYLFERKYPIYVVSNKESIDADGEGSEAARRFKKLQQTFKDLKEPEQILLECIDVRLFGGIVTIKKAKGKKKSESSTEEDSAAAFNLTGPVQFALLNPSLNGVELRMHQNTSVFASSEEKKQGAIGTTTVVPYAVNQIHGWINPYSARYTNLSDDDVNIMLKALWESINNVNTRTKANQNSLLLLQIVYSDTNKKIYGLDRLIKLDSRDKKGEQLRSIDDYDLDLTKLTEKVNLDNVQEVRYYTEAEKIKNFLNGKPKFIEMVFHDFKSNSGVHI
ncbi:MAG: type I-B CRISPR-associated protein Cas7/Csh2 [Ignavibacteriaceae bacterium]|nr:type I-B CRISPR-associated protein Cas7/Csh2 [Ignavibacteriaceae bacterium]